MKDISIVLPSYRPDEHLINTIDGLINFGFEDIIVVNDGAGAEYNHIYDEIRKRKPCTILVHEVNRGKGAALKTAFKWYIANRNGFGVVTADGDGQHRPEDILACANEMRSSGLIVLGARDFSLPNVPEKSRKGNNLTSSIFKRFVRMDITDTQTGLRAIPASKLEELVSVGGNRYEYETNMLLYMKRRKWDFREVTIETIYLNDNKATHFRPVRDSVRIYSLIIKFFFTSSFMKFVYSSMFCYGVDWCLFTLLGYLMSNSDVEFLSTVLPYAGARLVSSLINYSLNRLVFNNRGEKIKNTILKYYLLVVFIFVVGSVSVYLLTLGLMQIKAIAEYCSSDLSRQMLKSIIKLPVDLALYLVSYNVQRKYIFNKGEY